MTNNNFLLIEINNTIDSDILYNTLNMKWMEFNLFVIQKYKVFINK